MSSRIDLEKALQEVEDWRKRLLADMQKLDSRDPRHIADLLHSRLCRWNHIDGCNWEYDSWDQMFENTARKEYLEKAKKFLKYVERFDIKEQDYAAFLDLCTGKGL